MYICLCNALKSSDLIAAHPEATGSVASVFKHFNCQPQCGKCVPYLREAVCGQAKISAS